MMWATLTSAFSKDFDISFCRKFRPRSYVDDLKVMIPVRTKQSLIILQCSNSFWWNLLFFFLNPKNDVGKF